MTLRALLEKTNQDLADNFNGGQPINNRISASGLINKPFQKISQKLWLRKKVRQEFILEGDYSFRNDTSKGIYFKVSRKEYKTKGYSYSKDFADFKIWVDEGRSFSKECLDLEVENVGLKILERERESRDEINKERRDNVAELKSDLKEAGVTLKQFKDFMYKFENLDYKDQAEFKK